MGSQRAHNASSPSVVFVLICLCLKRCCKHHSARWCWWNYTGKLKPLAFDTVPIELRWWKCNTLVSLRPFCHFSLRFDESAAAVYSVTINLTILKIIWTWAETCRGHIRSRFLDLMKTLEPVQLHSDTILQDRSRHYKFEGFPPPTDPTPRAALKHACKRTQRWFLNVYWQSPCWWFKCVLFSFFSLFETGMGAREGGGQSLRNHQGREGGPKICPDAPDAPSGDRKMEATREAQRTRKSKLHTGLYWGRVGWRVKLIYLLFFCLFVSCPTVPSVFMWLLFKSPPTQVIFSFSIFFFLFLLLLFVFLFAIISV